ncbi:MAG: aminoacyl-tRNA hydrolase [Candidatus Omnitrophica bacterium]|nr:aminoacyl-tRNA hydrolase [Candidatus Omnitrophota bacterium]
MKIIVGLGNPGLRYRHTRHNAGFMAVELLAKKHRMSLKKKGFGGRYAVGRIKGEEVLLFEPMTFMNLSGDALASICSSRLDEENGLLVITDDVDLPLGKIRIRKNGSSGGHNGLRSIIDRIGSDFARLRIGVGDEKLLVTDTADFVLSRFPRKDKGVLNECLEAAAECAETWLSESVEKAMNAYN